MKPSVGRIVHYFPSELATAELEDLFPLGDDQSRLGHHARMSRHGPHAAIITAVHSDVCVDLRVFPPLRDDQAIAAVTDRKGDSAGHWEWPPRV